jgi:CBS domain-containing protein
MSNNSLSKICVKPTDSVKAALKQLSTIDAGTTSLPAGMVLVLDTKQRLMGVATDGDIRRALSRGLSLTSPIAKIMNRRPFLIEGPTTSAEIFSIIARKSKEENWHDNRLRNRLNKIVVVDKNQRVLDVVSSYDLWLKSDARFKQIGVVGLGYVGLTLALT